ncbi:cytochrome c biogenesis CcdA family protein [Rubrobacter calidifluminis]|uniref:cytochrome c biogenesis CcdA family protein n=1 Tax=Rubrobacter calidifluminis TaxID=1392640 RepID=UPI002361CC2F|nr:cytochrome c biogenesis protein CcdA [Rubrobacter calidifluminis]
MSGLQSLVANWFSGIGGALPFGLAFAAGMVAAVTPCGFAMLPAYLSLYLGSGEDLDGRSLPSRLGRALVVGAVASSGFVLLFTAIGAVISAGGAAVLSAMPAVGVAIGVALVLVGLWMLAGRSLYVGTFERLAPSPAKEVSVRGFFLFGVAYGLASMSCALPLFLVLVGSSLASGGTLTGIGRFLDFALGMAVVLVGLTLALALFKQGIVKWVRGALPYVRFASAALLVLAGAYIIYYWAVQGGVPAGRLP